MECQHSQFQFFEMKKTNLNSHPQHYMENLIHSHPIHDYLLFFPKKTVESVDVQRPNFQKQYWWRQEDDWVDFMQVLKIGSWQRKVVGRDIRERLKRDDIKVFIIEKRKRMVELKTSVCEKSLFFREGRRDKDLRIWSFCVPPIVQSFRVEEFVKDDEIRQCQFGVCVLRIVQSFRVKSNQILAADAERFR
ncbi:hypothetical protein Dsin_000944 [Dipteronia sinensis]|uniref:Uncharacterized protein n=1 Tax=Dipteronia sinensis TaxID=43782 RepID=A0AAE0B308_9ROSI|nr:hypothetical protein Dsin_000944 [Dipteronia sinensis]